MEKIDYTKIQQANGSHLPLFGSKTEPGVFYYATFGYEFSKKNFESGNTGSDMPSMKCLSLTYSGVESIPDEIFEDLKIQYPQEYGLEWVKMLFPQFYVQNNAGKEVTIYKLTAPDD